MTKRVALYTRVSTSDGQTIHNQLRDLNLAAAQQGKSLKNYPAIAPMTLLTKNLLAPNCGKIGGLTLVLRV